MSNPILLINMQAQAYSNSMVNIYKTVNGKNISINTSTGSTTENDVQCNVNVTMPRPVGDPSVPIQGTEGDDIILGTFNPDIIFGKGGDDAIQGREATDTLYGNAGNDNLQGGTSPDILFGGDGNDFIAGGFEDDFLCGGNGDYKLYAQSGDDILVGGSGKDYFDCGDGVDLVWDFHPSEGDTMTVDCEDVRSN